MAIAFTAAAAGLESGLRQPGIHSLCETEDQ
jgi:hypothetical protein